MNNVPQNNQNENNFVKSIVVFVKQFQFKFNKIIAFMERYFS